MLTVSYHSLEMNYCRALDSILSLCETVMNLLCRFSYLCHISLFISKKKTMSSLVPGQTCRVPKMMVNGFCMHGTINKNMCVLFSDENDLVMLNSILGSLGAYLFFCVSFLPPLQMF